MFTRQQLAGNKWGDANGLKVQHGVIGPWPCDECKELSQYGDIGPTTNYIFCKNPNCDFERIVDKVRHVIKENDGTWWSFDADGAKTRIRAQ